MSNTDGSDLVVDIEKLALNNNFYDWFITTNKLIDAVNPLNIYDITARKGLTESRANGHVILDVDSGKGIKTFPDDGTGKVTLDFESLTEKASPSNDDLFVIEQPATGNSNNVYKIFATNMLPPILTGNHIFTGTITVAALNVNDNVIRLQYGDATTENDSGLILDTTTSSKVKFTYDNAIQAWFSNKNLGLNSGYSFVTNSGERRANFKFGTYGSNQFDTGLELMMGQNSTQGDDKSFIIEGRNSSKSFEFIYKDYTNTDTETTLFYSQVETVNPVTSTFKVMDKIQIGNVSGSIDFKNDTSLTTLGRSAYEANRIPISNSDGILDNKWTNRYVTTQHSGIAVGDIVKLYDDTNNQATVVKSALTSSSGEEEAYSLGIVERLSGGKAYVVTHGQFDGLFGLLPGSVYYLTTGSPNYTTTKPTSGIVKPVFIATSTTGGIFFPMSAQGVSFGRFNAVAASGGTLISGSTVTSDAPNDIFTLDAGSGISLETDPSSNKIIIRAATAGSQPTYSTIVPNNGDTVSAIGPNETLILAGIGGIEVTGDNNTAGDVLNIRGRYFRTVSWSGESTNDISGSYTAASFDDTLNVYAGVGINVSPHPSGNGFRIDATGSAISSVAPNSQELNIFKVSTGDSVLGYFGGTTPSAVTKLAPTANSILTSTSASRIEWQTPSTFVSEKLASSTSELSKFSMSTGLTSGLNRHFGIAVLSKTTTNLNKLTNHNFPAFTFTSLNNINGAVIGLREGDGIKLNVDNSTSSALNNALPIITIKNNYPIGIGKININDTGEIITSAGTQTDYVNLVRSSPNLSQSAGVVGGVVVVYWTAYSPAIQSSDQTTTQSTTFPGRSPNTSKVFTASSRLGGTISNNLGTRINFATGSTNNGIFSNLQKENGGSGDLYYTEELQGKTITISVWAVSNTAGSQTFRLSYYPGRMAGYAGGTSTFSPILTATTTPQQFTFTVNVTSVTNTTVQAGTLPVPPNIAICNDGVDTTGQDIIFWGPQVEFSSSYSGKLLPTNNGLASLYTETNNSVNFDTTNSPISIDGDTNSNTIYFNIQSNGITNNYLATMLDNTVKVGTGSTNTNNTPQDLAIGTNSVLGRVGNGDLKSVNMTELGAMLGTTQFIQVQTDDSGTLLPSESTTIRIKGGTGITTSISTNNEVIITSTGSPGGGSIGFVGDWNGSTSSSSVSGTFTKLLFLDGDINYSASTSGTDGAVVQGSFNWANSSWGGSTNGGPGLIFGQGTKNASLSSLQTKLSQVGNGKQNSQLPFISVPSDGTTQSSLSYIGRETTGQTTVIDRVVGFDSSGNLVASDKFASSLIFDSGKITGLSASVASGQITISVPTNGIVKFPNLSSTNGFYFGESNNLGLVMDDNGTNGQSDFIFATAELSSSYLSSFTNGTYITSINLGGAGLSTDGGGNLTALVRPTSTTLKTRYFGDTPSGWTNISGTGLPRICMPEAGFMIGEGPTSSTSSLSTGMYLRTDTTNNALTFTNYNFTATGTARTIAKDRSTRIGLEVLNVPASGAAATNYTGSANTAYITHSFVPSGATTTVDQFTVTQSSKKSYKYFIHAEDSSGDFFTTELVVQVKASLTGISTSNIIQYGSTTTNSTSLPTVTFSLTTSGSSLTVTLVSSSSSLSYKVLKYEI